MPRRTFPLTAHQQALEENRRLRTVGLRRCRKCKDVKALTSFPFANKKFNQRRHECLKCWAKESWRRRLTPILNRANL